MAEKKTIVFLTDFDFENPSGAGWNRVINYSKALALENINSILVSAKYDYTSKFLKNEIGDKVFCIIGEKSKYKATFEDFHFKRYFNFLKTIFQFSDSFDSKLFLLYNSKFSSVLITLLYLKLLNHQKVYIEKNELQTSIGLNLQFYYESWIKNMLSQPYKFVRIVTGFLTDILTIFYTGIIVISTRFHKLYGLTNKNIIKIPILIDPKEIKTRNDKNIQAPHFKIGYFGFIGEKKDGVFSLVKAVRNISKKIPKIELHLYGNFVSSFNSKTKKLLNQNPIFYHGFISTEKVKNMLLNFDLLVLVRPQNLQTMYGFSTKLGEYLYSASPVLVTDVSDNTIYLKDNENAFVMEVGSKIKLSQLENKIIEICGISKDSLIEIGTRGRETAIINFGYQNYSKMMKNFLFQ